MSRRDTYAQMAPIYDVVYSFKDYRKEAREIAAAVRKHSARPPRTLLDVACGTGAHLEHFQKWFTVEGLDLDRAMLRVARRRLPGVPLHRADFKQFDLGRQFDAVTCLFSAVGHATTVADLNRAVAAMARHVKPGGVLVVEPWITPQRYRPGHAQVASADGAGLTVLRMSFSARRGKRRLHLEFHYLVRDKKGVRYLKESFEMGLFTDEEYRSAFRSAGLKMGARGKGPMGRGLYVGFQPVN